MSSPCFGAVEEGDRRGDRERGRFGELDDRLALALTDDRTGAGVAGGGGGGRCELCRVQTVEAGGLDRAVAIEVDRQRL